MSLTTDAYTELLIAGETVVVNKYFKKWLEDRSVPKLVEKRVLLYEIIDFEEDMSVCYGQRPVSGSIMDSGSISVLVDNFMVNTMKNSLLRYCEYAKESLTNIKDRSIHLNEIKATMDNYVADTIKSMESNAHR